MYATSVATIWLFGIRNPPSKILLELAELRQLLASRTMYDVDMRGEHFRGFH